MGDQNRLLNPLRLITGVRSHHGYRRVVRLAKGGHLQEYAARCRYWRVRLECGHDLDVDWSRKPRVGARMRCAQCSEEPLGEWMQRRERR